MRTTLNLDDQLLKLVKHWAVERGLSLSEAIDNVLRQFFLNPPKECKPVSLITSSGTGVKPGVDLDNARSLMDIMDDPA